MDATWKLKDVFDGWYMERLYLTYEDNFVPYFTKRFLKTISSPQLKLLVELK